MIGHKQAFSRPGALMADDVTRLERAAGVVALDNSDLLAGLAMQGVHHLRSAANARKPRRMNDATLIAALATNADPRLREALIPLFLRQPHLAALVPDIADSLAPAAALTLRHFYAAATYLQRFWHSTLRLYLDEFSALPDYFGQSVFHLPSPEDHFGEAGLRALAAFFARQTGQDWLSVYATNMDLLLKQLSLEQSSYAR
jgi:hypothetical protein